MRKMSEKRRIRLVATDCDGVLTDGGMYYSERGEEMKRFNAKDGMGFELLREAGILTAIVTGEDCELVRRRSRKLKVTELKVGSREKLRDVEEICKRHGIRLEEVAYIGDDINDLEVMERVGVSYAPADAVKRVRERAGHVCERKGGEGVFREVADAILKAEHPEAE